MTRRGSETWTVDVPMDDLPELPPLPPELRHKLDIALTQPAHSNRTGPTPSTCAGCGWCWRACRRSPSPPRSTACADNSPRSPRARRSCCRAATARRRSPANTEPHIRGNVRTLLQMAVVLTYGSSMPVVKVARIAGQYAKPRSAELDAPGPAVLPGRHHQLAHPDAGGAGCRTRSRMIRAYANSGATMNLLRALTSGGMADLHMVHDWNKDFVLKSPAGERYEALATEIDRGLRFMSACGVSDSSLAATEIFASHEALLLDYERAMLRMDTREESARLYDLSAHFLWIGERTRQLDGAHVALAELLANPIGLKIGPTTSPELAVEYVERLNPHNVPGRLTLVSPNGQRQGPRHAAGHRGEGHRIRQPGDLAVRPDARQHARVVHRLQDPPLRPNRRRGTGLLRGTPEPGHPPRRHPRRVTGGGRHRVPRRRTGDLRPGSARPLRDACDPRLNTQQSWNWPSSWRRCSAHSWFDH